MDEEEDLDEPDMEEEEEDDERNMINIGAHQYNDSNQIEINRKKFKENNASDQKDSLFFYAFPQISVLQTPLLEFFDVFKAILRRFFYFN